MLTNLDIYNKLQDMLYDRYLNIYVYNQYADIDGIERYFKYLDNRIKQVCYGNILKFMITKSNQDNVTKDQDEIITESEWYYINYLYYNYEGIRQAFGNTGVKSFWDDVNKRWDSGDVVKWDDFNNQGVIDYRKFKCILRYIKNISQVSFTLKDFLKFCNEFVKYDDNKIEIYVDNTSFPTPTDIILYSNIKHQTVSELEQNIKNFYKDILPWYDISFKQKSLPINKSIE